jgi:hypothetical protein
VWLLHRLLHPRSDEAPPPVADRSLMQSLGGWLDQEDGDSRYEEGKAARRGYYYSQETSLVLI